MKVQRIAILLIILLNLSCKDDNPEIVKAIPIEEEEGKEEEEIILCDQSSCWNSAFYVCRDTTYINLFTRNKGWTGGDATYSVDLKNGKRLWMFGDTFIDQVSEDRSRPAFRLINNSLILQNEMSFQTIHGGTATQPEAFAKPPEATDWYWPGDATVANGKLYLFMHGFGNETGGAWDFFRTSVDLLTLDPETLEIQKSERLFNDMTISWGATIMEDLDYTYIYGVLSDVAEKRLYVARTNSDLSIEWEYFDGTLWVKDPIKANAIFNGISEQFSVFKDHDMYYLLTQQGVFGKKIYLYTAPTPEGIFESGRVIYCTPETGDNIFTYNAFVHDNVYQDSLLISYNINSFDFNDLLESADNYRPYFVRVGNWRKQ